MSLSTYLLNNYAINTYRNLLGMNVKANLRMNGATPCYLGSTQDSKYKNTIQAMDKQIVRFRTVYIILFLICWKYYSLSAIIN